MYTYKWLSLAFTSAENMQGFVKASNAYIDIEQKEKHPEAKDTEECWLSDPLADLLTTDMYVQDDNEPSQYYVHISFCTAYVFVKLRHIECLHATLNFQCTLTVCFTSYHTQMSA